MRCACITLAKSSDKVVNLFTLTPSAGSISNKVITGPGEILVTLPCTPNVSNACTSCVALFLSSSSDKIFEISTGSFKRLAAGNW